MDVSDPAAVEARVRDVEPNAIIHLAAVSSVIARSASIHTAVR